MMATNLSIYKNSSYEIAVKTPNSSPLLLQSMNFESLDKSSSNTLKRNPKMELSKADLLKLLSYLEGELQARDIVIATLKCEKMKNMLSHGQYKSSSLSDPFCALNRDGFAASTKSFDQAEVTDHQLNALENLVLQHRKSQIRMAKILKDAETRHRKVIQELIEEKKKHEHDTAQGDDITFGLEKERTRLKQDLEIERQAKKRLEKDLKKISDVSDEDKNRQKQIVLLLLAERKKIVMKYIEERKRSEDLAQILSEEKSRIDSMAEGLEEESKKSLQMEAELEKQLAQFDTESQILRASLQKEEKRVKELEAELEKVRNESYLLEKQLNEVQMAVMQGNASALSKASQQLPGKNQPTGWPEGANVTGPIALQTSTALGSTVAKVVQPTATVSSVPVSGPTTGVARSIPPGHGIRGVPYWTAVQPSPPGKDKRIGSNPSTAPRLGTPSQRLPHNSNVMNTNGNSDKKAVASRGVPPPIPPNKPVIPPKKDSLLIRRVDPSSCSISSDNSKLVKEIKPTVQSDAPESQVHEESNPELYQNLNVPSQSGVL